METNTLPFAPRRTWSRQPRRSWKYQSKRLYQVSDKRFALYPKEKLVERQGFVELQSWIDWLKARDEYGDVDEHWNDWHPDCFQSNLPRSESWGMEMWEDGWVCGNCVECSPEFFMEDEEVSEDDPLVALERQYGITTYHQELLVYRENTVYELKCVVCEDWAYTVQVSGDCIYEGVPDDDFYVSEDEYQDEQDELVRLRDQYYWIPEGWKRGGDYEDEVADLAWESRWLTIQLDIQVLSTPQETLEVEDSALYKTSLKYFRLQKYLGPRAAKYI